MDNTEVDTAILLENSIRERVQSIVRQEVERAVVNKIGTVIAAERDRMIMEISVTLGKIMQHAEARDTRPLWESTPEEFTLEHKHFNPHGLQPNQTTGEVKEI